MVGLISGHGEQVLVMGWILLENILLGVVRCGRFGEMVMIVLLFLGGWRLPGGWVCCGRVFTIITYLACLDWFLLCLGLCCLLLACPLSLS